MDQFLIDDYKQKVKDLHADLAALIGAITSVFAIANLPDDQFVPECIARVWPHWQKIGDWVPNGSRGPQRIVPKILEFETFCKTTYPPITLWDSTCWTTGQALQMLAEGLFNLLFKCAFDETNPMSVAQRRAALALEMPGSKMLWLAMRHRLQVETRKTRERHRPTVL